MLTQAPSPTTVRAGLLSLEDAHGVVLAGVHPRRSSRFDSLRPRPLLPVAGVPLVTYAIRWLAEGGLSRILCCTNGPARGVQDVAPFACDEDITLGFLEDWMPRGSAGCVRDAAARTSARSLVVVEGSVVPTVALAEVLATHREAGAGLTLVTHAGAGTTGAVAGGICVVERAALENVPVTGFHDIKEMLIPLLTRLGARVATHHAPGAPARVVDVATYLALNAWVLAGWARKGASSGAAPLIADPTAHVGNGVRVIGPVLLGPEVTVESGAILVGPTVVSAGSKIERGAVVSRSVLWQGCLIGAGAEVDLSVVADGVSTRPGARVYGALLTDRPATPLPAAVARPSRTESPHRRRAAPGWRATPGSPIAPAPR